VGLKPVSAVLAVFCLLLVFFPAISKEPDGAISLQARWLAVEERAGLEVGPGQEVLRLTLLPAVPLTETELVLSVPQGLTAHALSAPRTARFELIDSGPQFRLLRLSLGGLAAGSPQTLTIEIQAGWKHGEAPDLLVRGVSGDGRRLEERLRIGEIPVPGPDGQKSIARPREDGVRRHGAHEYSGAPLQRDQEQP
jgi:hypothetical protein